jgi:geranylgeranyl diphosphate synthase type II
MDHADVRRGRPTVHVKWNANTAILSGDQMLIEAYKLLAGVPKEKLSQCLDMFNKMATEICEGQQYDVDFEAKEMVSETEYLMMIGKKTAVLLATALQMGAYIAGASQDEQETLALFGTSIGLAFQIQDDILDVWGNPATFGKAIGGDISCNKKTYVTIIAEKIADEESRKELQHWYSQTLSDNTEKIARVKAIYERLGVRELCERSVRVRTQAAHISLDSLPQNAATQQLRQLADKLHSREV